MALWKFEKAIEMILKLELELKWDRFFRNCRYPGASLRRDSSTLFAVVCTCLRSSRRPWNRGNRVSAIFGWHSVEMVNLTPARARTFDCPGTVVINQRLAICLALKKQKRGLRWKADKKVTRNKDFFGRLEATIYPSSFNTFHVLTYR